MKAKIKKLIRKCLDYDIESIPEQPPSVMWFSLLRNANHDNKIISLFSRFFIWWNLHVYTGKDKPNRYNCTVCFEGFEEITQLWNHCVINEHVVKGKT